MNRGREAQEEEEEEESVERKKKSGEERERVKIGERAAAGREHGKERHRDRRKEEGEEGQRQRANSEGRVVLILVDRNFRKSDRGRSKVTRWLQTHTFSQLPNQHASARYSHIVSSFPRVSVRT